MADRTGFHACVAQPNTPETDLQPRVPHLVTFWTAGEEIAIRIMAEAPDDAIDKARRMTDEAIARHRV
ncbi:hypothetical protein [Noviherbaspirillum galbum]|uniref:Uncharacterized protein n=1 Tax=Noviherbaspirillum galbum TaxID=2709383 RepID=A0A6B3SNR7_9BURK|nr:hypothetical protein [Noviherbaspirillum galbum]NEX60102.1 hypothetical protein [Noviherbaspirillum galbum]